jgi:DNA polymerase-3 subunit epsilon
LSSFATIPYQKETRGPHPHTFVAIDFETATSDATSACALGIAVVEDGYVVDSASWLVQPPANEYAWYCTRVHGLTAEHTAQSPEFDEVWPEVRPYLETGRLLAHNASFDARVLAALVARHQLDPPPLEIACTVAMSRAALPHLRDHKLSTVCDACGIELVHHDAASDALACARVALLCAGLAGTTSIDEATRSLSVPVRHVQLASSPI